MSIMIKINDDWIITCCTDVASGPTIVIRPDDDDDDV
jgi:hypothetical protein